MFTVKFSGEDTNATIDLHCMKCKEVVDWFYVLEEFGEVLTKKELMKQIVDITAELNKGNLNDWFKPCIHYKYD